MYYQAVLRVQSVWDAGAQMPGGDGPTTHAMQGGACRLRRLLGRRRGHTHEQHLKMAIHALATKTACLCTPRIEASEQCPVCGAEWVFVPLPVYLYFRVQYCCLRTSLEHFDRLDETLVRRSMILASWEKFADVDNDYRPYVWADMVPKCLA